MKKKTVITTEKHEVWIIRQPADEAEEQEWDADESPFSANRVIAPREAVDVTEPQPDES
jgi:hypothetical protein